MKQFHDLIDIYCLQTLQNLYVFPVTSDLALRDFGFTRLKKRRGFVFELIKLNFNSNTACLNY